MDADELSQLLNGRAGRGTRASAGSTISGSALQRLLNNQEADVAKPNFSLGWTELRLQDQSWNSFDQRKKQKRSYNPTQRILKTEEERAPANKFAQNGASLERVRALLGRSTCHCIMS